MNSVVGWIDNNWASLVAPVGVFVAALVVTLWLRRRAYLALKRWSARTEWQGDDILVDAAQRTSVLWCVIVSAYLGVAVSMLPAFWKDLAGKGLWTLLIVSLVLTALNLTTRFTAYYGKRWEASARSTAVVRDVAWAVILLLAALTLLETWGAPVAAVLLFMGLVALAVLIALRESLVNIYAGISLKSGGHIKVGDYVRLEAGEEGHVAEIRLANSQIAALDGSSVIVANRKLIHSTVINYGRPLKRARDPFVFSGRMHLKELTGLRARSLQELLTVLKTVPDSVTYYHTHRFLEEHHYLTPSPANDFALWVNEILGDQILGERLAAIDTFEFATLGELKDRIAGIIEEHLSVDPDHGDAHRNVLDGMEFYFVKEVSIVLPTPYRAYDLREFVEVLRKLSLGSLYFHVFESRLRLGKGKNDFSLWMEQNLGEKDLAEQIARFDPYTYTLEGLRSSLIQLIERQLK